MSDRVAFTWLKEGQKASNILMMTIIPMVLMQWISQGFRIRSRKQNVCISFNVCSIRHIFSFGTKIIKYLILIIKKLCYCNFCYQNHGCFGIEQIDDKGKCDKNTRYMDTKLCFKCSNQDVNAQRIFATCARNWVKFWHSALPSLV